MPFDPTDWAELLGEATENIPHLRSRLEGEQLGETLASFAMAWANLGAVADDERYVDVADGLSEQVPDTYFASAAERSVTVARARLALAHPDGALANEAARTANRIRQSFFRESAQVTLTCATMGMPFEAGDSLKYPPCDNPLSIPGPGKVDAALTTARAIGTDHIRIRALCSVAEGATMEGRRDTALAVLQEATALSERFLGSREEDVARGWDGWSDDVPASTFEPAALVAVGWARAGNPERSRAMLAPWPERYPDPAPKDWTPFSRACIRIGDLAPAIRCFERYRQRTASVRNTQARAGAYHLIAKGWVFAALVAGRPPFLATAEDLANEMMTFTEITHDGLRPLRAFCDLALGHHMFGNATKASEAMACAEDLREVLLTTDRIGLAWERMRRAAEIGKAWAALGNPDQSIRKYRIAVETSAGLSASPAALGQAVQSLGEAMELMWRRRWTASHSQLSASRV